MLRLEGVTVGYPRRPAVIRAVSASFRPGAITAVVGPNGAGKTTLLRALLGLRRPAEGRALLDDGDVGSIPAPVRARRLAYVPQQPGAVFGYSVERFVGFGVRSEPAAADRVAEAIERLELGDLARDRIDRLSAGQRQRAAVARALAQLSRGGDRARYLLADEPLSAMDPRFVLCTLEAIREQARGGPTGAILVLHDLEIARREADHALVLGADGRIAADGPAGAVLTPEVLGPVYGVRFDDAAGSGLVAVEPAKASGASPVD